MTHMVIFRSPEGKPGYHQSEGLDEAMRFAEMLRNQEQVTDARIFRMDEVPIEFKTYYRVEMASESAERPARPERGDTPADTAVDTAPAGPEAAAPPEPDGDGASTATGEQAEQAEPEPADAAESGSGRHGLFSRS